MRRVFRRARPPGTVTGMLRQRAAADPYSIPVIVAGRDGAQDETVTCASAWQRARAAAAWLEDRTDVGDRVLVAALAGRDFIAGMAGAMLAGCVPVPVPLPVTDTASGCRDIMRDCAPGAILIGDGLFGLFAGFPLQAGYISVVPDAPGNWEPSCEPAADDTAWIQYASGTTGFPKGALISHRAAMAGLRATAAHLRLRAGTRIASSVPPWESLGWTAILLALHRECTVLVTRPQDWADDPVSWLEQVSRYRAEVTPLPSSAFAVMAARLRETPAERIAALDLSSWRTAWTAADADMAGPDGTGAFAAALAGTGLRRDLVRELRGAAETGRLPAGDAPEGPRRRVTAGTASSPPDPAPGQIRTRPATRPETPSPARTAPRPT